MKRTTPAARRARILEMQRLAQERARLFRLARRNRAGELLTGFKLIPVKGERHRKNLIEKGARPVLPSSEMREIKQEVGLL